MPSTHKLLVQHSTLAFLAEHAPDMKIGHALTITAKFANIDADNLIDGQALAILAATELGFSDNGEIPPKEDRRNAVKWALDRAQYRHAWVVTGPVDKPMERLLADADILWEQRGWA